LDGLVFEIADRLDDLRCRETCWLRARRDELVREQRRLRVEELAVTRVLDERGALDDAIAAADGVSARTARETVETARALAALPHVAAAAYDGDLSGEQLERVVELADGATDAEWASSAPHMDPAELARRVRCAKTPTNAESRTRRDARYLSLKWSADRGMLHLRGALADLDGALFEATIQRLTEQMRPAKSEAWERFDRRAADALVVLCAPPETDAVPDPHAPRMATQPLLQIPVPLEGPATICGIPLPAALVEQVRAIATLGPVLIDDDGSIIAVGRRFPGLSPKVARAIRLRDQQCRCGLNCGIRYGLEIHHLAPRSWAAPTTSRTSCSSTPPTTATSSPTGPGPSSATPTSPAGCAAPFTPTSHRRKPASTACHPHPDRPAEPSDPSAPPNFSACVPRRPRRDSRARTSTLKTT
jgi:hypothetical protein